MNKEINLLIEKEQLRQNFEFIPKDGAYLKKIFEKAEFLSHNIFGECLGFVFFYCNDEKKESSYITLLLVNEKYRNNGIGAGMVKYVLFLAKNRGFKNCRLEVLKRNLSAINFYKSIGFFVAKELQEKYLMEFNLISNEN